MNFRFSIRTSLICLILIAAFLRLSYWQWERHLEKKELALTLEKRLLETPLETEELFEKSGEEKDLYFRRINIKGRFDFQHEIVLRNRRHDGLPGSHVLTPLKIEGRKEAILVSRGFIPLDYSAREKREVFQREEYSSVLGILKEPTEGHFLAPKDPEASAHGLWVDTWLRADVQKIQQQLSYPLLPFVVELLPENLSTESISTELMKSSHGKEELLVLSSRGIPDASAIGDLSQYPIPAFTTTLPPTRHLGYVYEWGFMAFMTLCIGILLQLKRGVRKDKRALA